MDRDQLDKYLEGIKEKLKNDYSLEPITIKILMEKLGVKKRDQNVISTIVELLEKHGLKTDSEIELYWIENPITILFKNNNSLLPTRKFSFCIDLLPSANTKPIFVSPNTPIEVAITIMVSKNFSQLPVMTTEREVKGILSWQTIAHNYFLNNNPTFVSQIMTKAVIVDNSTSLFDVIEIIKINDYALVRNHENKTLQGIVTSSDLAEHFRELSEPFLLIGKCEYLVRKLISGYFTPKELQSSKKDIDLQKKEETSIYDLNFSDYIMLLSPIENWKRLNLSIDQKTFLKTLESIRKIRNDIMHFYPEENNIMKIELINEGIRILDFAIKSRSKI